MGDVATEATVPAEEGSPVTRWKARRRAHGQVLVLVVLGMVGLIAMVAVVIDGGNAWVQQRGTQNGTDAAAEAGAVVLVQQMGGAALPAAYTSWDADVAAAVNGALGQNNTTLASAYYTNFEGTLLTTTGTTTTNNAAKVGGGIIPTGTAGVQVQGSRTFSTYFAGVIGLNRMTTPASATARAGILETANFLPVTFPILFHMCSGNGSLAAGSSQWQITDLTTAQVEYSTLYSPPPAQNTRPKEVIVPLCKNGPGTVGWLNLSSATSATAPLWVQTNPGNPNAPALQTLLNGYDGQVVSIPMFDGICKTQPSTTDLSACTLTGAYGKNTWYHIPYFTSFFLDHAFTSGNNSVVCNSGPGSPPVGGNGSNGCLKGWWVTGVGTGQVSQYIGGLANPNLGVQLIK